MTNRPRKDTGPAARPLTKRQQAWQQREANVQRRVVLAIGGAIGLALLLIIGGIVWDRLLVPGRTVIAVNGQELSRGEYDRILRTQTLAQMAQSLQFTKLLGPNASFGENQGSFTQQVVEANSRLATLGTPRGLREPTDDTVVSSWIDQQLIAEKAKADFGIDPAQGEVDQEIVARLGSLLEEPAPLTSTTELTATAGVTMTSTAGETDEAPSPAETAAASDASVATAEATASTETTPAGGPTQTPAPTASPTASPVAEVATDKVAQIVKVLHDEYEAILQDLPQGATSDLTTPHATEADFAAALRAQYRDDLIRTRVKEKLVPTVNEDDTTPPEQINARHILLKVPKPEPTPTVTPTVEDSTATATAEATATTEETATAEPAPTPTLAPEALEELFAERKAEIDRIYEQVKANPDQFAELARQYSEDDTNKEQGGDLGSFGRGQMVGPFEEAAFALKENEISAPVRTEFGWHIIQRLPEDPEAKLSRQRDAAFDTWVAELRASATIVPAPTPTATEIPLPSPAVTEPAAEGTSTSPAAESTGDAAPEGTADVEPEATTEATTAAP